MPVHHVSLVRNPDVVALGEECFRPFTLAVADAKILQVDRRRRWRSIGIAVWPSSCCWRSSGDTLRLGRSTGSGAARKIFFPLPSYFTFSELASRSRCSRGSSDSLANCAFCLAPAAAAGAGSDLRRVHPASGPGHGQDRDDAPARSRCAVLVLLSAPAFMPRSLERWTGEPKPSRCRPAFLQSERRRSAASSSAVPPR